MSDFTHLDETGQLRMVDVADKAVTLRVAAAACRVVVGPKVFPLLLAGSLPKGDVWAAARVACIMAAKNTAQLIPLCHPLPLDAIEVEAELAGDRVRIVSRVACEGKTGVEMEAMVAAAVGALTVYDMVKSAGKGIQIGPVRLLEKTGGKSGTWRRSRE